MKGGEPWRKTFPWTKARPVFALGLCCVHTRRDLKSLYLFCSWAAVQSLLWTPPRRRVDREAEAAQDPDDLHLSPTQRTGESVSGDPLSRHLHQGRHRTEDRPDRSSSTSKWKSDYLVLDRVHTSSDDGGLAFVLCVHPLSGAQIHGIKRVSACC